MKIRLSRNDLVRPLQHVTAVVERRQTLPILSNVLLKADEHELSIIGTDLEVELIGRVPTIVIEKGEVTVSAQKLMGIVRELPEAAEIELALVDHRLTIVCGRFKSALSTLPAKDFPNVGESGEKSAFIVDAKRLKHLIDRTSFAIAQQDVRYFLNGMLFEINGENLTVVSTDGHRLALSKCRLTQSVTEPIRAIVPKKGVLEIQRLLTEVDDEVTIMIGTNHIMMELLNFSLTSKLVEGRFPDYDKVIPKDGDKFVLADRTELRQALSRTAILSNQKFMGIRVCLSNSTLHLSTNNPEQEEAEEMINVEYQGDQLEVGFNVVYIQDILAALNSDKIKIILHDADSGVLIEAPENDDSIYVVMPMKL